MTLHRRGIVAALSLLVLAALLAGLVGVGASADVVVAPFAGDWSTFSGNGNLQLQVEDPAHGPQSMHTSWANNISCASPTVYYSGGYHIGGQGSDDGSTAGCTDSTGRHLTAWYQSNSGAPGASDNRHGTFSVDVAADDKSFRGTYNEFSDGTSGSYDATFTGDFPNSGRTGSQAALIVGLGDSLASGEGSPDAPKHGDTPARWLDARCDRSTKSFEAQVVARLRKNNPQRQFTFQYLACSGASIPEGLLGPYAGVHPVKPDLPAQIDAARALIGEGKPDAVLLAAGVNDLGFGDVAYFCAHHSSPCMDKSYTGGLTLDEWMKEQLGSLPHRYFQLASAMQSAGWSSKRIFITQYPNLFNDGHGDLCNTLFFENLGAVNVHLTRPEVLWLRGTLIKLNNEVATAAHDFGWQLVKPPAGFNIRGYCTGRAGWIVSYRDSKATEGDAKGALHANSEGQMAIANQVYPVVRRALALQ